MNSHEHDTYYKRSTLMKMKEIDLYKLSEKLQKKRLEVQGIIRYHKNKIKEHSQKKEEAAVSEQKLKDTLLLVQNATISKYGENNIEKRFPADNDDDPYGEIVPIDVGQNMIEQTPTEPVRAKQRSKAVMGRQFKIRDAISVHGEPVRAIQLIELTDLPKKQITNCLDTMVEDGILYKERHGASVYWGLTNWNTRPKINLKNAQKEQSPPEIALNQREVAEIRSRYTNAFFSVAMEPATADRVAEWINENNEHGIQVTRKGVYDDIRKSKHIKLVGKDGRNNLYQKSTDPEGLTPDTSTSTDGNGSDGDPDPTIEEAIRNIVNDKDSPFVISGA